uniref:Uncharacterized protein n=1 Tax=Arundo donax TaxID=35708 RepID=A0A0A8ZNF6_ARUDO
MLLKTTVVITMA